MSEVALKGSRLCVGEGSASSFDRGKESEKLLPRNLKWFRGGLVSKAHRFVYHSTLGSRSIKKKKKKKESDHLRGASLRTRLSRV